ERVVVVGGRRRGRRGRAGNERAGEDSCQAEPSPAPCPGRPVCAPREAPFLIHADRVPHKGLHMWRVTPRAPPAGGGPSTEPPESLPATRHTPDRLGRRDRRGDYAG